MSSSSDVPEAYRQFFFVNAGGPIRKVLEATNRCGGSLLDS